MSQQQEQHSTEEFIELVKQENILWDLTNINYKNIKKKAQVWKKISERFGLSVEDCKKKWKGLRDCCNRDFNRKAVSGQGAEEPESSWRYREQMMFVREHMKPRSTKSNFDNFSEESLPETPNRLVADDSLLFDFELPESSPHNFDMTTPSPNTERASTSSLSHRPTKRKITMESTFVSTMESVKEFLKKPRPTVSPATTAELDEDEHFCKSMLKKIKAFPRRIKNEVKIEILQYLNSVEDEVENNSQTQ